MPGRGSWSCTGSRQRRTARRGAVIVGGAEMEGRSWRGRSRRRARRNHDVDMDAIRNLAREAAAYEEVPAAPAGRTGHRSGFVDAERLGADERREGPATDEVRFLDGDDPRPTAGRHRWSDLEVDVTSWLPPDELEAATRP